MTSLLITLFAYLLDKKFGEYSFLKHPVILFGEMIEFFEERFYKDEIQRGAFLVVFMVLNIGIVSLLLESFLHSLGTLLNIILSSFIGSIFVAHHMLKASVQNVIDAEDKAEAVSHIVSRDTDGMSESDVYKASIESYAENLSDGVIAPLFYLLFFGLTGMIVYKVINTMDSMVGYRNKRYENFGKVAAYLDDVANFIPSRLTALLIMLRNKDALKKYGVLGFVKDAKAHQSPNAGYPITAAALSLGVKLGGDTKYFGLVKSKPYFGEGRKNITKKDVENVLRILV